MSRPSTPGWRAATEEVCTSAWCAPRHLTPKPRRVLWTLAAQEACRTLSTPPGRLPPKIVAADPCSTVSTTAKVCSPAPAPRHQSDHDHPHVRRGGRPVAREWPWCRCRAPLLPTSGAGRWLGSSPRLVPLGSPPGRLVALQEPRAPEASHRLLRAWFLRPRAIGCGGPAPQPHSQLAADRAPPVLGRSTCC